jgi:hypothetical protein
VRRHAKAPSSDPAHAAGPTAAAGRNARGLFGLACLCVLSLAAFLGSSAPPVGAAEAFPGQGFLPQNRAWEMVSTPEKNGGEVIPNSSMTRAAVDGSALAFTSLQGFGDVAGAAIHFAYLAQRSADPDPGDNGWSTHGITPRQDSLGALLVVGEPAYQGIFSPDLSHAAYFAQTPLTSEDPNVAGIPTLYLRDDLRQAGPGHYRLLTACPACSSPFEGPLFRFVGKPEFAGASDDFQHAIFESNLPLAEGGSPFASNVYEWDHGTVRFAGVLPNGEPSTGSGAGSSARDGNFTRTHTPAIATDGSRFVFTGQPDFSQGSLADEGALYARIGGHTTIQLNASELASPEAPQRARYWDLSNDGSRIFFTTNEKLTDEDASGSGNLYMWKRADHDETQQVAIDATGGTFTLTFNEAITDPIDSNASAGTVQSELEALKTVKPGNVSVSGGPGDAGATSPYEVTFTGDFAGANVAELQVDGSGLSGGGAGAAATTTEPVENLTLLDTGAGSVIGASDDGRYLYFTGESFEIYLWHEGAISYVGKVDSGDGEELVGGRPAAITTRQSQVSPDGRLLLFQSHFGKNLLSVRGGVDYDHGNCFGNLGSCRELYLYSADNDELKCVSCNPSGAAATVDAASRATHLTFDGDFKLPQGLVTESAYQSRVVSSGGRYAYFTTAERLVPADTNGVPDAYLYDNDTDRPYLLSSGEDSSPSYFLDASEDGTDVFFATRERLSGWDVDGAYDVYDARVGGGFPEPPPPPPGCQGDACQPAPSALNDPTPASSSFQGAGNPKPARARKTRCAKGKRQVKGRKGNARCVKRQGAKRAANNERRAGR